MIGLALLLAAQSAPQTAYQEHNCDAPMTQMDMNACSALEFEAADRALNAAYRDAIASERQADREIPAGDPRGTGEAKLREAQRAWIAFRDAHCTVQSWEARGGSMEPMLYSLCRTRLTRARISELKPTDTDDR